MFGLLDSFFDCCSGLFSGTISLCWVDSIAGAICSTSFFFLVIKILIVVQISKLNQWTNQGHMWLGADGENYLLGASYLADEGLFSKRDILNYWPAGYPILIYIFGIFGKAQSLTFLGIFQSLVFSFSVFTFTKEIAINGFKKLSRVLCLLLLINPTLSLNSLSVGYESLAASGYLLILALVLYLYRVQNYRKRCSYASSSRLVA